ncbi:MAG: hypothetical protein AB1651_14600 [Pseudomonadota bacterium]
MSKLSEVYGVARGIPLTYVARAYVDDKLVNSLSRDKHIVIYGGSKQGKTCVRKHSLKDEDYVVVQCGSSTTRIQIYEMLLKHAGVSLRVTDTTTVSGTKTVEVTAGGKGGLPFLAEASGEAKGGYERANEDTREATSIEIDPSDANDVIRALKLAQFKKFVVLEDFHYLSEEVQREIAFDLKAFHEKSEIVFMVVGVWLESNKLVLYNGDLAGRLVPVDADRWEAADLEKVITAGEPMLNIEFPKPVRQEILALCQANVGVLQETCYRLCEKEGVFQTAKDKKLVGTVDNVRDIVKSIGAEQAGRYQKFLEEFAEGLNKTELEMYRWIAYVVVTSNAADLKKGLKLATLHRRMNQVHPKRRGQLLQNNVLQALENVAKVQHKYHVKPVILDFDQTENQLRVTDSGFILYIASQDRNDLLERIGLDPVAIEGAEAAKAEATVTDPLPFENKTE